MGMVSMSTGENLSASLEDYLEAIFNLSSNGEAARSKDIAESLEVSRASVTGALRSLADKELINYRPYGVVTLTRRGKDVASQVARKHGIIKSFFTEVLGVDSAEAQEAACKTEHALGPTIVGRLLGFMEFVTQNDERSKLAGQFKVFCERNGCDESFYLSATKDFVD